MTKLDELGRRVAALQLDMERRFGQLRSWLLLITRVLLLSVGPDSQLGHLILSGLGR